MSTNQLLKNPFEGQRWEQDTEHIIYLPEIFAEFEKRQDLYIIGSRGTGKTTYLKALNWETRVENRSIHAQIENCDVFKDRYIGIYIDAVSFGLSVFEMSDNEDYSLMLVYSLWAELNVLLGLIESIKGLYKNDYIDFTIKDEQSQCNKIYDYLSNIFGDTTLKNRKSTGTDYDITLLEETITPLLKKVVDEREELKYKCDSYSFGDLIEETVPKLVCLCDKKNEIKWCTKICFDAIESAPNFHKIINTFVAKKLSERVWFIISGLSHRLIDMDQTYIPNHNLTNDDKAHIDLDKTFFLSDAARRNEFDSLAEGICDLRLKHSDNNNTIDVNKKFDLNAYLGYWTMNQILDVYLKSKKTISVGNEFKVFMDLVEKNNEKKKYLTDFPPYIETYYYDILGKTKKWDGTLQKSRQKNRDTGKKYVVIMLALLRNYKLTYSTPYAGKRQYMYLCNSTREFLQLMAALFDVRMKQYPSKDLSYFFDFEAKLTQNEIQAQTEATVKVAEDKYEGIKNKSNKEIITKKMSIFIDTCGNILYDLQAKEELSSLISEERGIFTVSLKDNTSNDKLLSFLKTAADDTYIKILVENNKNNVRIINFELSRLFAPKYKFSFRSPWNKIKIDYFMLNDLCINQPNKKNKKFSFESASQKLIEHVEKRYELNKATTHQKKLC